MTRAAAVIGSLGVLVAAWLLLVSMNGALDDERAFRGAVGCASGSGEADRRDGDCLWTVAARIERTEEETGRKTSSYWLYVTEADGTSSRTRITGSAQEHPIARAKARVEVTYWRGQIRYVDFDSGRRYTTADPRGDYKLFCAWGLAVGFHGLLYLWLWYWNARLSAGPPRTAGWQAGVPVTGGFCLTAVGAFAPWPTDSPAAAFRLVGVCALVVVAVCSAAALVLWWRRRGDDTVAVTPVVPAAEQVFPGRILGEMPYASGTSRKGYLVVGPARLAATPDRTGAADRRHVPPTLTPVRVRPPYWTDPARAGNALRSLVLECEDDGVRVLIVTRGKHMPWVLGALQPTPCANSSGRRNTDVS
ncbi:hypothetical protein [Streptomyces yerevanensis]|uniref:hypothetical protein n=1 Tax=Streptomyces yerevanensis TaxID=66378 RepID=UPI0005261ACE|nr:hypothetical protein [Streptomyces yerevanensis]